jgi:hypothetical protein
MDILLLLHGSWQVFYAKTRIRLEEKQILGGLYPVIRNGRLYLKILPRMPGISEDLRLKPGKTETDRDAERAAGAGVKKRLISPVSPLRSNGQRRGGF